MTDQLSEEQWAFYKENGYLELGKVLEGSELAALQQRLDDIMLGKADIPYENILMQLDSETGRYEDAGVQSNGWKGATLAYRKIQNLEHDPIFRNYLEKPLFKEINSHLYGQDTPIACFRAMFMNKPAQRGTILPWHQDAWTNLDRQPEITVWTAIDPATIANGCVQVIPGSHKLGRVNPSHNSGYLTEEQMDQYCPDDKIVYLELEPGEAVLLHNWLLHRSDVNKTDIPRRGFSVCYMDGRTKSEWNEVFTPLFERAGAGV
ncbi:MAG TPA: phytanoyl-CoA dioxygenase family protein [Capsulimonadaceae bacterium]|nr:phytanoyl-CoA dioxygenase family protein [Capsulimonadaceae bacterium]